MKRMNMKQSIRTRRTAAGTFFKKTLPAVFAALVLPFAAAQGMRVQAAEAEYPEARLACARLGGSEPEAYIIDGCTYVPFRAYCRLLDSDAGSFLWNDASKTSTYRSGTVTVTAKAGSPLLVANGRYLYRAESRIINDTMYTPLTLLGKAFTAEVRWDSGTGVVSLAEPQGALESGDSYYDAGEVYWLSRLIYAEAEGEPEAGKIAVGNVVLNRVASKDFPDTIYGVIFDTTGGTVQFYRPGNARINRTPSEECIAAAKICLDGYTVSERALFFLNVRTATNFWITANRPYLFDIGLHSFYA